MNVVTSNDQRPPIEVIHRVSAQPLGARSHVRPRPACFLIVKHSTCLFTTAQYPESRIVWRNHWLQI